MDNIPSPSLRFGSKNFSFCCLIDLTVSVAITIELCQNLKGPSQQLRPPLSHLKIRINEWWNETYCTLKGAMTVSAKFYPPFFTGTLLSNLAIKLIFHFYSTQSRHRGKTLIATTTYPRTDDTFWVDVTADQNADNLWNIVTDVQMRTGS